MDISTVQYRVQILECHHQPATSDRPRYATTMYMYCLHMHTAAAGNVAQISLLSLQYVLYALLCVQKKKIRTQILKHFEMKVGLKARMQDF